MKTAVPKVGEWTEVRARTAVEKHLRSHPWARATDIAKEFEMDISMATRICGSLRGEGFR